MTLRPALLKVFGSWQRIVRTHTHTHTRTQSTRIAVDHLTRCRCLQLESTVRMAAATTNALHKNAINRTVLLRFMKMFEPPSMLHVHAPCPEVQVTVLMSFYSFVLLLLLRFIYLAGHTQRERERAECLLKWPKMVTIDRWGPRSKTLRSVRRAQIEH